jgi:hypothetical protein
MARTQDNVLMLLLALAIGGAYLAIRYKNQWMIALMVGAGGIFMLCGGLRMFVTRRARVPTQGSSLNPRLEYHAGFTARLWGILYAMMSVVLFGIAYSMWPARDGSTDVVGLLSRSPFLSGLVMTAVGAGIAMYGLTRVIARKEAFVETGASTAGRYFMGIYACLVGTLIVAIGLLVAFAPGLLSAFGQWIRDILKSLG